MQFVRHEICLQYVARRLSEGWRIVSQDGFNVILQSPDGAILRPVDLRNDVETLRPNAAGAETSIMHQSPGSGEHWDKVDEASPDAKTTDIYNFKVTSYQRDLYELPASSGSGVINFVKIYFRVAYSSSYTGYAKPSLRSDTTVTDGTEVEAGDGEEVFTTYSQQWNTNPATVSDPWTWDDIDALQIGVSLKSHASGYVICTQVYVEVDYTPPPAAGRSFGFIMG